MIEHGPLQATYENVLTSHLSLHITRKALSFTGKKSADSKPDFVTTSNSIYISSSLNISMKI
jgi:hypothetical protein